jgi:hypothetical protein
MEFTLAQTKAWCGIVPPDNSCECRRPMGHQGFHSSKDARWVWLDLSEIPRTWGCSSTQSFSTFWGFYKFNDRMRIMLT